MAASLLFGYEAWTINCGRILYSFWDTERGNDNLDWNDLQMFFRVIKSGTVKQSTDLEISPRSSTIVSFESCRVISYWQFQFLAFDLEFEGHAVAM